MTTRALTSPEIILLTQALETRHRHRDRLFLLLAVTTGFRVSELLSLRFSQHLTPTSQVAKEITVARRSMKGGHGPRAKAVRSRRGPLNETARSAVETYLATLPVPPTGGTFVFSSRNGYYRPLKKASTGPLIGPVECGPLAAAVAASAVSESPTRLGERSLADSQAVLGNATTRVLERLLASSGNLVGANVEFTCADDVPQAGALFALPALLGEGLLRHTRSFYALSPGFYPLESIFLYLALLALVRCRSLEQTRYQSPGE